MARSQNRPARIFAEFAENYNQYKKMRAFQILQASHDNFSNT